MFHRGCLPFILCDYFIYFIYLQENGQSRLRQAQEDVEEIKVIMLDNMNKVDERQEKLGELEDRADKLLEKVELLCDAYFYLIVLSCNKYYLKLLDKKHGHLFIHSMVLWSFMVC